MNIYDLFTWMIQAILLIPIGLLLLIAIGLMGLGGEPTAGEFFSFIGIYFGIPVLTIASTVVIPLLEKERPKLRHLRLIGVSIYGAGALWVLHYIFTTGGEEYLRSGASSAAPFYLIGMALIYLLFCLTLFGYIRKKPLNISTDQIVAIVAHTVSVVIVGFSTFLTTGDMILGREALALNIVATTIIYLLFIIAPLWAIFRPNKVSLISVVAAQIIYMIGLVLIAATSVATILEEVNMLVFMIPLAYVMIAAVKLRVLERA